MSQPSEIENIDDQQTLAIFIKLWGSYDLDHSLTIRFEVCFPLLGSHIWESVTKIVKSQILHCLCKCIHS